MNIKERIIWIDIAKGLTIILTIIGHTVEFGGDIRNFIFSFHMPLFFVLAGYTFSVPHNKKEWGKKIVKDFKRLYIPCIIVLTLEALFRFVLYSFDFTFLIQNIYEAANQLLWGNGCSYTLNGINFIGIGAIWFLITLLFAKIIFSGVEMVFKENIKIKSVIYSLCAFLGVFVGRKIWLPQNLDLVLVALFFLYIGTLFKKYDLKKEKNSIVIFGCFFIFWILALNNGIYIELATRHYPYSIISIIEAICGVYCIFKLCKTLSKISFIGNPLAYIGKYSLDLLCIHNLDNIFFSWSYTGGTLQQLKVSFLRVLCDLAFLILWIIIKTNFQRQKTNKFKSLRSEFFQ